MNFKLSDELIDEINQLISLGDEAKLVDKINHLHFSDIAEIMERLDIEAAFKIFDTLESEITAEILTELSEERRSEILERLTPKQIAEEIGELHTDDAVDIVAELSHEIKNEVIKHIDDVEHAQDIVELLRYSEDSAGGLMAKEFLQVNENWNVFTCIKELRRQAKEISRVHSIYVVDDENRLTGRLSLKDLLTTSNRTLIKEIAKKRLDYVNVDTHAEDVARIMQKYDLEAIAVVDELGKLVGRITIDDIVDVMQEAAEKDFQMASGISKDVEANDTIIELTRARIPWLILGLFGGLVAVFVAGRFEEAILQYGVLFFFTPLIAGMAGNAGIQSSAIIVQALARDNLSGSLVNRLIKELMLSTLNGFILSLLLLITVHFVLNIDFIISITVGISLIVVIIVASLIGTFTPIALNKIKIDPALATGPFITTCNDIFGLLIYFSLAKIIIGF